MWAKRAGKSATAKLNKLRAIEGLARDGREIFLCLLQKPGGRANSSFTRAIAATEAFLQEVLSSFDIHAPPEAVLVVKQPPLDYAIERSASKGRGPGRAIRTAGWNRLLFARRASTRSRLSRSPS